MLLPTNSKYFHIWLSFLKESAAVNQDVSAQVFFNAAFYLNLIYIEKSQLFKILS